MCALLAGLVDLSIVDQDREDSSLHVDRTDQLCRSRFAFARFFWGGGEGESLRFRGEPGAASCAANLGKRKWPS